MAYTTHYRAGMFKTSGPHESLDEKLALMQLRLETLQLREKFRALIREAATDDDPARRIERTGHCEQVLSVLSNVQRRLGAMIDAA